MNITRQTPFGYAITMDIPLTKEQFNDFLYTDKHVQNICPELPPCERKFLINGTTPQDWDDFFGGCTTHCKPCKYNIKQIEE